MKIALCLSGQPRVVEIGYQKLYNTIHKNNDVDVFIHTWFDPENLSTQSAIPGRENHRLSSDAVDKLVQLYQPKKLSLINQKFGIVILNIHKKLLKELILGFLEL
jgi:hypothetical protein